MMDKAMGTAMNEAILEDLSLDQGRFSGSLVLNARAEDLPALELLVDGVRAGEAMVVRSGETTFAVSADLPVEVLADGISTVHFRIMGQPHPLARYVLRAGAAIDGDVLAELSDIRAEVDALKHAFMLDARDEKIRKVDRHMLVAEVAERVLAASEMAQGPEEAHVPSGTSPGPGPLSDE